MHNKRTCVLYPKMHVLCSFLSFVCIAREIAVQGPSNSHDFQKCLIGVTKYMRVMHTCV